MQILEHGAAEAQRLLFFPLHGGARMDVLMTYHFGGWAALFAAAGKSEEGRSVEV